MLSEKRIRDYLESTASKNPVAPSGGSALAMCSALSIALGELVANTTIDKKGYEDIWDIMKEYSKELSEFREESIQDIDKDAMTYTEAILAFKLPKNTDEEVKKRKKEIENSFKQAALIPLELAERTLKTFDIINRIIEIGNKNASGDAYVAALIAEAVIKGSLSNSKHNLAWINDIEFIKQIEVRSDDIKKKLKEKSKYINQ